eukprot:1161348-Pelagomonas_calceolata.AAC.7
MAAKHWPCSRCGRFPMKWLHDSCEFSRPAKAWSLDFCLHHHSPLLGAACCRYILSELAKMFGREPTHVPLLAGITASLLLDACASLRTLQEVRLLAMPLPSGG